MPSQVGLHLVINSSNRFKVGLYVDKVLPGNRMGHAAPEPLGRDRGRAGEGVAQVQSATYGDIVFHDKINEATHALMGDLVPEVNSTFLKAVAPSTLAEDILTDQDRRHLDRLDVPMLLISGRENQMFVPESTERTWRMLSDAVGDNIQHQVFDGFGHLDCYLSGQAKEPIWERLAGFLEG